MRSRHAGVSCGCSLLFPRALYVVGRDSLKSFSTTPQGAQSERQILDKIGLAMGIQDKADWYKVTKKQIVQNGGKELFRHVSSVPLLLRRVYAEHQWEDNKFAEAGRPPSGYWKDPSNIRDLIERIGQDLGVTQLSDWGSVKRQDITNRPGGWQIFRKFNTLQEALKAAYPEHSWDALGFEDSARMPQGYWRDKQNQMNFLDQVAKELDIQQPSDWCRVSRVEVTRRGGRGLFEVYPSLEAALREVYPSVQWDSARFRRNAPAGYWKDKKNLMLSLERAEKQLGITKPEDWYSVALTDLREVGFNPDAVNRLKLAELLSEKYPTFKWDKVYLLGSRLAQQKRLEQSVRQLFEGVDIIINARKEANIVNPATMAYLEIDIYLPSINLGFEFQERHHYSQHADGYAPFQAIKEKDDLKKKLAKEKGITLIIVPCWWDGTNESLAAVIKRVRPDLLTHVQIDESKVYSEEMPEGFLDSDKTNIDGIGEPIKASFFTFSSINPVSWWMFEKYDGVRGFWNPKTKHFYSRTGNMLFFPREVVDSMPADTFLDGELWFGRDNFQESIKMVQRLDKSTIDWSKFKYMAFDIPSPHEGTYAERYNKLVSLVSSKEWKYLDVAPRVECTGSDHLEQFFQDVIDRGGEGVILRDPNSPYEPGRSPGYLKHKKYRDAEAKIVSAIGSHQWECELPNGVRFTAPAGTGEFRTRWQPKAGDIVSFKHRGYLLATKKPKLPTLYRIRTDMKWEDVLKNWKEKS